MKKKKKYETYLSSYNVIFPLDETKWYRYVEDVIAIIKLTRVRYYFTILSLMS